MIKQHTIVSCGDNGSARPPSQKKWPDFVFWLSSLSLLAVMGLTRQVFPWVNVDHVVKKPQQERLFSVDEQ
jgi:hypothetical protein